MTSKRQPPKVPLVEFPDDKFQHLMALIEDRHHQSALSIAADYGAQQGAQYMLAQICDYLRKRGYHKGLISALLYELTPIKEEEPCSKRQILKDLESICKRLQEELDS